MVSAKLVGHHHFYIIKDLQIGTTTISCQKGIDTMLDKNTLPKDCVNFRQSSAAVAMTREMADGTPANFLSKGSRYNARQKCH